MAESQNVEYKVPWRDDYLKWVCGFANAQGGTIYIGIDDAGNVVGVQNVKKLLEDIPNKIQSGLGIVADVNKHTKEGKDYLEIIVEPSSFPIFGEKGVVNLGKLVPAVVAIVGGGFNLAETRIIAHRAYKVFYEEGIFAFDDDVDVLDVVEESLDDDVELI